MAATLTPLPSFVLAARCIVVVLQGMQSVLFLRRLPLPVVCVGQNMRYVDA